MNRGLHVALALLCGMSTAGRGETLKEFLMRNHVPIGSFSRTELMQAVQGLGKSDGQKMVLAYVAIEGGVVSGPARLLKYDASSGTLFSQQTPLKKEDVCSGPIEHIYLFGEVNLVSTGISPSAECLLVLDRALELRKVLYGFGPVEVAPGLVVITENMIHFAPVHPERLQLADLARGATMELYPAQGDALRERLIAAHATQMPPQAVCALMNDPCDPAIFDEEIQQLGTDGEGRFAFVVSQSASHALAPEQIPVTFTAQTVLYVYRRGRDGWSYCEEEIPEGQRVPIVNALHSDFDRVARGCATTFAVQPDMSTASFNPFLNR